MWSASISTSTGVALIWHVVTSVSTAAVAVGSDAVARLVASQRSPELLPVTSSTLSFDLPAWGLPSEEYGCETPGALQLACVGASHAFVEVVASVSPAYAVSLPLLSAPKWTTG